VQFIPADASMPEMPAAKESSQEKQLQGRLAELEKKIKEIKKGAPVRPEAMTVAEDEQPEDARIHIRGNIRNLGALVPRGFIQAAVKGKAPGIPSDQSGRLQLAQWMTSRDNPLTARVLVNRVWHWLYGAGIVRTTDNFGSTGELPSHPELLDWLAQQFITSGGRMKALHKLMLMSATYRQASGTVPGEDPADATRFALRSSLFGRRHRQRMEAEVIRDSILAVSGKLNLQSGGPGIKPRIRADLLDASQRNKWPVLKEEGPAQWRRSIYIYVKRQLLMPSLELFDAPTTTDSCALRTQSTVPTQALVLMNDEFVEEQAGHLAGRAAAEAGDDPERFVERLFLLTLAKKPSASKRQQALEFLQARTEAGSRETARRDLAHVLLNSSEFVYIE